MKLLLRLTISLLIIFVSCTNESKKNINEDGLPNSEEIDSSKIEVVETLFDKDTFDLSVKKELLKELQICNIESKKAEIDYNNPTCSPRFFELFQLSEKIELKNAFLLQIKARTNGFPLRRLIVFERDKGVLVKTNGFVANLIEKRKSPNGYDDLVLRFNHLDQGENVFFNCLFKWSGKKYEYHSVEVIEGPGWGGAVKQELKDSVSVEVLKDIRNNKMLF